MMNTKGFISMMNTKDFISSIIFKKKNEHDEIMSFNGQSIIFRLSIKETRNMDTYNYMSILTII